MDKDLACFLSSLLDSKFTEAKDRSKHFIVGPSKFHCLKV